MHYFTGKLHFKEIKEQKNILIFNKLFHLISIKLKFIQYSIFLQPASFGSFPKSSLVVCSPHFSCKQQELLYSRNYLDSKEGTTTIKVDNPFSPESELLATALLASGFRQVPNNDSFYDIYLPCPAGTFYNSSSNGTQGCTPCSPGMFLASL